MNVQIAHTKKNVQKIINIEHYMNLLTHSSLKEKENSFHKKDKKSIDYEPYTVKEHSLR